MNYYRIKIQYDGTGYYGFQWQKDLPTIQNDINLTLEKLVPGKITTMGASRTDTGVHALEQYVKITSENEISDPGIIAQFKLSLPPQIRCLEFIPCAGDYRPNHSVRKEYIYLFTNTIGDNHTTRRFIANNPYPLDLEAMKTCVAALEGKHDFHNFVSTGSNVKSTEREITFCELSVIDPKSIFGDSDLFVLEDNLGKVYQLKFEASGFLKQMIRHLMTALWKVGNGRITVEEFLNLLDGPKKQKSLWKVAHPKGLFLYRIRY